MARRKSKEIEKEIEKENIEIEKEDVIEEEEKITEDKIKEALAPLKKEIKKMEKVLSTGSTLLDLSITGGVTPEGGIPGGMIMEIFGPESAGKSALLAEISGSCQLNGGEARFDDPEARFDAEYSRIYGFELDKENYFRPDTVKEMFNGLWGWKPKDNSVINVSCEDSLAALSTEMEMEDEDKMGMKRAKDFSEGLRKTCRLIAKNNWLIVCSNQERHGGTPGGKAIPYYSSVRIRMAPCFKGSKIKKTMRIGSASVDKIIGVTSTCFIKKSSIDDPYRECNVSIVFGYGIDDIRENLTFLKIHKGDQKYIVGGQEYVQINKAIEVVEEWGLEEDIRQQTIALWKEIQEKMKIIRKQKVRR